MVDVYFSNFFPVCFSSQSEAQQLSEARTGTEEQMQKLKLAEEELAQVQYKI